MPSGINASPNMLPKPVEYSDDEMYEEKENLGGIGGNNAWLTSNASHKLRQQISASLRRSTATPNQFKLREPSDILKQQTSNALNDMRLMSSKLGVFRAGSVFVGEQKSGRTSYRVKVDLKHVDISKSYACGFLHISGLTDEFPELTTFFEAEIIGERYGFLTRKWEADEVVDKQHWTRFPAFKDYEGCFNDDAFKYDSKNKSKLFMRWKEHFLVPDHRIQSINGASFAGFYYICFDAELGVINGFYYHQNSEWFQQLTLTHQAERTFDSFDFR